jgi:hypothetical protein
MYIMLCTALQLQAVLHATAVASCAARVDTSTATGCGHQQQVTTLCHIFMDI